MTHDSTSARQDDHGPSGGRIGSLVARAGNLEYDRFLFFSDAVFAIAITLLVVDLRVPASANFRAAHVIRTAVPGMVGFGIGFVAIGIFWLGHHSMWRYIPVADGPLIRLNLLFLGTIAFLPYPTALISAGTSQTASVVFFAACAGAAGLAQFAIWLYAVRVPGLVDSAFNRRQRRLMALRTLRGPLVFLVSIPVAFASPVAAQYLWIMIGVLGLAISRLARRQESGKPEADPAAG
jgi:uncharacterized membrane protein